MTRTRSATFLLASLTLLLAGCAEGPSHPWTQTPAPRGFPELADKIDPESPGLESYAVALAAGDSASAVEALLLHYSGADLFSAPQGAFADTMTAAAEILEGRLTLPLHPTWDLPSDPD